MTSAWEDGSWSVTFLNSDGVGCKTDGAYGKLESGNFSFSFLPDTAVQIVFFFFFKISYKILFFF